MDTTIVQIKGQISNNNLVGINDVIVHINSTGSGTRTKFGMRVITPNLSYLEIANVVSGDALIYASKSATTDGVTKKEANGDWWVGVGQFDVIVHNVPNIRVWNCWSPNATMELNKIIPLLPDSASELTVQTSNYESPFDISRLARLKNLSFVGLTGKKVFGPLGVFSDSNVSKFNYMNFEDSYVYGSIATDLTAHDKLISTSVFTGSLITA